MLVCSAAVAVSERPERLLLIFNIILVAATTVGCVQSYVARSRDGSRSLSLKWAAAIVILLALDFRYLVWNTLPLMETALWGSWTYSRLTSAG